MKKASKQVKRKQGEPIDPAAFGVDLPSVLVDIKPFLQGTRKEIGDRAGGLPPQVVSDLLCGRRPVSLGVLAALAHASGGKLIVRYEPPNK
jgi:hypothetical protein